MSSNSKNKAPVRHIACAVRGRLANRNAVRYAIDLALEHDARLTFFLIMSGDFLASAAPTMSPTKTLYERLREIGEYVLVLMRDQALDKGLTEVEYQMRIGNVRDNLREFVVQTNAQILVMGRPTENEPRSVFTPAEFETFIQELQGLSDLVIDVIDPVQPEAR